MIRRTFINEKSFREAKGKGRTSTIVQATNLIVSLANICFAKENKASDDIGRPDDEVLTSSQGSMLSVLISLFLHNGFLRFSSLPASPFRQISLSDGGPLGLSLSFLGAPPIARAKCTARLDNHLRIGFSSDSRGQWRITNRRILLSGSGFALSRKRLGRCARLLRHPFFASIASRRELLNRRIYQNKIKTAF
jgi:hypothetical protein